MSGEEGAGVAVGAAAQEQKVKNGKLHRVPASETLDKNLLVLIGELLGIVEVLDINGVDNWPSGGIGDLVKELLLQKAVVGVFVIKRHGSLIGEEDLPLIEVELVRGAGRGSQQSSRKSVGKRTAGNGHLEDAVARQASLLALGDIGSEGGGQGVDVGERTKIRLPAHCEVCRGYSAGGEG